MSEPNIRYEVNELRLLFEVGQVLDGAGNLAAQLSATLELVARYTAMLRGALGILVSDSSEIEAEAMYGLKGDEREKASYKTSGGVSAKVMESGRAMVVSKSSEEAFLLNRSGSSKWTKEELAFICVPITLENKVFGTLSVDRLFADSVRIEEDIRLLQVLASLVAHSLKTRLNFYAMQAAVLEENRRFQQLARGRFAAENLVYLSAPMRLAMEELAAVANFATPVLLQGECGTGKELAASLVHANSPRSGRPFIKVNCASIPESLLEAELFGSELFADGLASRRKGRFAMAHGGTIYLDEVGSIGLAGQAKLLQVLKEREFELAGSGERIHVDVRVIAASSCKLERLVEEGRFRRDLYYVLSVYPVFFPPLRERRMDIMPLVNHFLDKIGESGGRKIVSISEAATQMLMNYAWPGNIRELENIIERAVILSGSTKVIEAHHLPANMQTQSVDRNKIIAAGDNLEEALASLEKQMIIAALEKTEGNMVQAAGQLGISERIMGLRMKKYALDYKDFRTIGKLRDNKGAV